ncbi:MAG: hypothetical protein ABI743_01125 [bacterium]
MTSLIPLIGAGSALLSLLAELRPVTAPPPDTEHAESAPKESPAALGVAFVLVVLAMGTLAMLDRRYQGTLEAAQGVLFGGVITLVVELLDRRRRAQPRLATLAPLAGALLIVSVTQMLGDDALVGRLWGSVLGSALAAGVLCCTIPDRRLSATPFVPLVLGALTAGSALAHLRTEPQINDVIPLLATLGLVVGHIGDVAGWVAARSAERLPVGRVLGGLLAAALFIGGSAVIGLRYMQLNDLFITASAGVLTAGLVAWLLSDSEEPQPGYAALAGLIWVGSATVAFGTKLHGFGIAIWAIGALVMLLLLSARRGLLSVGLLVGLTFYRYLLEALSVPGTTLDLSQHYALMGFLIGVTLPLALADWTAILQRRHDMVALVLGAIGGLAGGALGLIAMTVFATKGTIGLVAGLGVGALIAGMQPTPRVGALSAAAALGALLILANSVQDTALTLERTTKITLVLWVALIGAILALFLGWAGRTQTPAKEGDA